MAQIELRQPRTVMRKSCACCAATSTSARENASFPYSSRPITICILPLSFLVTWCCCHVESRSPAAEFVFGLGHQRTLSMCRAMLLPEEVYMPSLLLSPDRMERSVDLRRRGAEDLSGDGPAEASNDVEDFALRRDFRPPGKRGTNYCFYSRTSQQAFFDFWEIWPGKHTTQRAHRLRPTVLSCLLPPQSHNMWPELLLVPFSPP
jgi:hypothetical protein